MMRIQQLGLLLLLALSCKEGLAQDNNEKEESRSHIRGGAAAAAPSEGELSSDKNPNSHNEEEFKKPSGYSPLKAVGKAPEVVSEQKHTKEFEEAHRMPHDDEEESVSDNTPTPIRSHKDLSMGHHRAGVIEAKKKASDLVHEEENDTNNRRRTTTRRGRRRMVDEGGKEHIECLPPDQQFIVTCKDDAELECLDELQEAGVEIVHMIKNTEYFAVCVEDKSEWSSLMALADVRDVEEDPWRTLKVAESHDVSGERRLQQTIPYGVELVGALDFWSRYQKQGESVKVCVVDTGLDNSHRDIDSSRTSGSNDGDLVRPWSQDGDGHGTHVAGTIAASDNNIGVVGVAPKVDLFIARVFNDQGRFTASSLIDAMNECAIAGSNIISMSLGGPSASRAEQNAVNALRDRGILLVAAAGNSGSIDNPLEFPSGYDAVMSVAAVDEDSQIALFSSHNAAVDIAGPGVAVESLEPGGGKDFKSGTSMSTPHVSAVAALLMSRFPNESAARIRQSMELTATDLGPCGPDKLFGHGLVNVMAAANYLETGSTSRNLQASCVEATVNTRTDEYGEETMWFIIRKPNANANTGEIVFRGGPYPNELVAEYTDTFFLPSDGCFEFRVTDRYGDGTCCEHGNGRHRFTFNGQELLFSDDFEDGELSVTFGCGNDGNTGGGNSPVCGNGIREAGEQCDEGNRNSNQGACTLNCRNARCGDGFVQPGEQCDEGSSNSNTGTCTNACQRPRCGDGFVQAGEECDRGNSNSNTGACTNACENARCGDGFIQAGEECDDGNNVNGDGCSATCQTESSSGGGSASSCGSNQATAKLDLVTDNWAYFQNELYFFDVASNDNEFIWYAARFDLGGNLRYEAEVCLDSSGCYDFYFMDALGNGLRSGGLTLTWNDRTALQISPGDNGSPWPNSNRMTYWGVRLGTCP
eukprot:CAMPEP_0117047798 /NCGR_PEP_ID=MMETSP0472-20121206/33016_1 /TAXON_ID=693140 ORGANISM="Tiarina fusus, Strain LIS" /NCGR_SAMPLE_ID=MMETSP0472 /ASSEMBLY_ACC=CAM_ASM_000603 /LENGTH=925 /DNA_ID=CAMNT_0004760603 /DNA_START=80 /DNA_END=2857 /DNA_ORIENTATION=-